MGRPPSGPLHTTHPDLFSELVYIHDGTPIREAHKSTRKMATWRDKSGHVWDSIVKSRATNRTGCPTCAINQRRRSRGFRSVADAYPNLVDLWSPRNQSSPGEEAFSTERIVWWKCAKEPHEYLMSVAKKTYRGYGCSICSGQQLLPGFNDLATTHPKLAEEWSPDNGKTPQEVTRGSGYRASWVCPANQEHVWESTVKNRTVGGSRCHRCIRRVSAPETEVYEFVRTLLPDLEVRQSDHSVLGRKELDIYIPELSLAIEFNGTYWHSEKFMPLGHREEKTALCREKGVHLLHVEEEDWRTLPDSIKELIADRKGSSKGPFV